MKVVSEASPTVYRRENHLQRVHCDASTRDDPILVRPYPLEVLVLVVHQIRRPEEQRHALHKRQRCSNTAGDLK